VLDPGAGRVGWVAAILGASVAANAIASNLRDLEAAVARFGEVVALRSARAFAALSLLLCALGPVRVAPLAAVPLLTLCGLTWFRRTERFGLIFIDGALLAGGLAAIAI